MTQVRKQILLLLLTAGNQKYVVRVPFSGVTFMLIFMNNGQKLQQLKVQRTWRSHCLLLYFLPMFLTKPKEACDVNVLCMRACVCVNNHAYSEQAYKLNVPKSIATCVLFCFLPAPLCEQQSPFTHTVFTDNGLKITSESPCHIQDALCLTYNSLKLVNAVSVIYFSCIKCVDSTGNYHV